VASDGYIVAEEVSHLRGIAPKALKHSP
jgi:hypothetical protein